VIEFIFGLVFALAVWAVDREKRQSKHREMNRIAESQIEDIIEEVEGDTPQQDLADRLNGL
jgi:hypothetical protein